VIVDAKVLVVAAKYVAVAVWVNVVTSGVGVTAVVIIVNGSDGDVAAGVVVSVAVDVVVDVVASVAT